jgi:hypothetical protein
LPSAGNPNPSSTGNLKIEDTERLGMEANRIRQVTKLSELIGYYQ